MSRLVLGSIELSLSNHLRVSSLGNCLVYTKKKEFIQLVKEDQKPVQDLVVENLNVAKEMDREDEKSLFSVLMMRRKSEE